MTTVDEPQRIVAALVAAGWRFVAKGSGHVRLEHPHASGSLIVATDPAADEYAEEVDAVVRHLDALARVGDSARRALDAMTEQGVIV
jgi:predicted RNA binding protein YcfA (HicA-like mRNA interferase family)